MAYCHCKGTCSTHNYHPIYNFLSYHHLSSSYYSFISFVSSITISKDVKEVLDHPRWWQAIIVEMQTLEQNGTRELVSLPSESKTVDYRWVYSIKVGPNSEVDCLKAQLVAKGYTHIYMLNYNDISLQWPKWLLSDFSLPWQPFVIGLLIN